MKAHVLVRKAFERAQKVHPDLTLRSLAQKSKVSPGFLSKVLSGQKEIGIELAEKLFKHLHMDTLQRDQVLAEMQNSLLKKKLKGARSRSLPSKTQIGLHDFTLMENDAEWLLGKWYRLTILDLVTCANFVEKAEWISSRLRISTSDAATALKELEKFGYLKRDEQNRLAKTYDNLRFPTKFSKETVRNYHAGLMKKAIVELEKKTGLQDFSRRLITSVGVASNPESLEKAKAILHEALYEAAAALAEGEATEVYQISLQLFPLTGK